jgi:hypothetical protein
MLHRLFLSTAYPLCVGAVFFAITGTAVRAQAQESPSPAQSEQAQKEPSAAENKPAGDVKPEDNGATTQPEANAPQSGNAASDKASDDKKPADGKAQEGDKKSEGDKKPEETKADSDKGMDAKEDDKNKEDKPKKPEKPEPKKLPRIGRFDGPLLPGQKWHVHDIRRPAPPVVTPGELSTYDKPGTPPSDAIVLFDGKDLSNWCHINPEEPSELLAAQWKVQDGYFEVTQGTGNLLTIDSFGSCQLHVEWQTPSPGRGDSQGRGNSGIFLMDSFEVQVLDSFKNRTYADGQAGAMYGQYPPMVNASREPGQWQIYDILFEAPEFSLEGKIETPAKLTLMHNGVFLHNRREYYGPTGGGVVPQYRTLTPAAPIRLQNHGNPVRYRNIWIRPLPTQP